MSELKAIQILINGQKIDFYFKDEADKVIADKDKDIQRLEKLCESYRIDCDNLAISDEQAKRAARTLLKKMNHQKYKRCLAIVKKCVDGENQLKKIKVRDMNSHQFWQFNNDYWKKWHKRWLAIAEKFKEAK